MMKSVIKGTYKLLKIHQNGEQKIIIQLNVLTPQKEHNEHKNEFYIHRYGDEMKSLLIIEDDDALLTLLSEYFNRNGYDVHLASGGHQASRILDAKEIDAVLSDYMMPDGDGKIVASKILEIKKKPVLIFATAYATEVLKKMHGVEEVFDKPYDLDTIHEKLTHLLD